MTKKDKRELELWRMVGHFESDHSHYCNCKMCKLRSELARITNEREDNDESDTTERDETTD